MYQLNMFKSSFELPQVHSDKSAFHALWNDPAVVNELHRAPAGRPSFLLHDGPPYANGNLHLGHFVNKTLKDATLKFKRLQGYFAPLVPGFDCHGLPVELEVEKLGHTKTDPVSFVAACKDYALSQVKLQTAEFQDFGVSADWAQPYLTLDPAFEAGAARYFTEMSGVVKRLRPVHWCPLCASSLAEAEVDYKPRQSDSLVVLFEVVGLDNTFLQVWTTTPYTLPANKAVAFGPSLDYVQVDEATEEGTRCLVRLRQESDSPELSAVDLSGWQVVSPFTGLVVPVLAADYVTSAGTGLVHLAPSFGMDDFRIGEAHGLAVESFVDEQGRFLPGLAGQFDWAQELAGKSLAEASKHVLEKLAFQVYSLTTMHHDYPHCWRHKKPLFFKASQEWFLDLTELGPRALEALEQVEFVPASGRERLSSMLRSRTSWCLSRNRLWGTPLADPQNPQEVQRLDAVAREGLGAWYAEGALAQPNANARTLDVWFDSGVTHELVMKARFGRTADLYLEGTDQHRGWFQSSLLTSVAHQGGPAGARAPYKTLLTHGFVVDEKGQKYSKSSRNYLPLQEMFKQHSPDVLRLWALSQDYTKDLKLSKESLARTVERYRKLRNTLRFCLQNTQDFEPSSPADGPLVLVHSLGAFQVAQLQALTAQVTAAADRFDFSAAVVAVTQFCENVSSEYFTAVKDVLYCDAPRSAARKEVQAVLWHAMAVLTRLLTPVLPYTAEEVFQLCKAKVEAAHAEGSPSCSLLLTLQNLKPSVALPGSPVNYEPLRALRGEVHRYVEENRSATLKSPATLELRVSAPVPLNEAELVDFFGCAAVVVVPAPAFAVDMARTTLALCPRCRCHRPSVLLRLCQRCEAVEAGLNAPVQVGDV